MTNDQIRIAVAEAMGWTDIREETIEYPDIEARSVTVWKGLAGITPEGKRRAVPNYPVRLDACATFEQSLDEIDGVEYVKHIDQLSFNNAFHAVTATPLNRCRAFLRTKGLWKEETI